MHSACQLPDTDRLLPSSRLDCGPYHQVTLLARGNTMYHGPADGIVPWFASLGYAYTPQRSGQVWTAAAAAAAWSWQAQLMRARAAALPGF